MKDATTDKNGNGEVNDQEAMLTTWVLDLMRNRHDLMRNRHANERLLLQIKNLVMEFIITKSKIRLDTKTFQ